MSTIDSFLDALPLPFPVRMHLIAPMMHVTAAWGAAKEGEFGAGVPHARVAIRSMVGALAQIQGDAKEWMDEAGFSGLGRAAVALAKQHAGEAAIPEATRVTLRGISTFAVAAVLEFGLSPEDIAKAAWAGDGLAT